MIEQSANGTSGRNSNGQFAKGNPGGPGNPYARRVAKLRSAMLNAVESEMVHIVQSLIDSAKKGDVQAAKLVLAYSLGKPVESVHPDAIDAHEKELIRQEGGGAPIVEFDAESLARVKRLVDAADCVH